MPQKVKFKDGPHFLRGRQTRTRDNVRLERSELLLRHKAEALVEALSGLQSLSGVQAVRDHHVRGADERWYVRFERCTDTDLTPKSTAMQDIRAERAVREYAEMQFLPYTDDPGWFYVWHFYPVTKRTGETYGWYLTHAELSCDCPDFENRQHLTDGYCKHMGAVRIHQGLPARKRPEIVSQFPDTDEGRTARKAWVIASRDLDFP